MTRLLLWDNRFHVLKYNNKSLEELSDKYDLFGPSFKSNITNPTMLFEIILLGLEHESLINVQTNSYLYDISVYLDWMTSNLGIVNLIRQVTTEIYYARGDSSPYLPLLNNISKQDDDPRDVFKQQLKKLVVKEKQISNKIDFTELFVSISSTGLSIDYHTFYYLLDMNDIIKLLYSIKKASETKNQSKGKGITNG